MTVYREKPGASILGCAVLAIGLMATFQAVSASFAAPATHDFGMSFYASGRAWIETGRPYEPHERPNFNPPSVTRALFVPLARLDLRRSLALWNVAGAICLASTWLLFYLHYRHSPGLVLGALGVLLCTLGAAYMVWFEGQLTWLLLPVTTLSWLAYREGRALAAGAWLGVLVAVKPFFALAAVPLGLAACLSAAAISIGISAASVMVSGIDVWQQWLRSGRDVVWLSRPGNASLWGLATRCRGFGLQDQAGLSEIGAWMLVSTGIVLAALFVWAGTRRDPATRWLLAMTTALLASPLGWTHYVPLLAPPLVACAAARRWNRSLSASVVLFCVPAGFLYALDSLAAALTIGSVYGFALLFLWAGVALLPEARGAVVEETSR